MLYKYITVLSIYYGKLQNGLISEFFIIIKALLSKY